MASRILILSVDSSLIELVQRDHEAIGVMGDPIALLDAVDQGPDALVWLDLDAAPSAQAQRLCERLLHAQWVQDVVVIGTELEQALCARLERVGVAVVLQKQFGASLRIQAWMHRLLNTTRASKTVPSRLQAVAEPSNDDANEPAAEDLDALVRDLRQQGKTREAIALLERAVATEAQLDVVRQRNKQLLRLYVEDLGDAQRAIDLCRRWRQRDPDNADLARVLNGLLTRLGAMDQSPAVHANVDPSGRKIAHDLQEPARSIRNYLRILQRRHAKHFDSDAQGLIQRAMDSSERMMSTVARTVVGPATATSKFCARQAAQSAVADLDRLIAERSAEVHISELPTIRGGVDDFRRVVQNLVTNAIVHGPIRNAKIEVAGEVSQGRLHVEVSDDGPGLSESMGGYGLGLSTVRAIVSGYGGEFSLSEGQDRGVIARFDWPVVSSQAVA